MMGLLGYIRDKHREIGSVFPLVVAGGVFALYLHSTRDVGGDYHGPTMSIVATEATSDNYRTQIFYSGEPIDLDRPTIIIVNDATN